jgi:hypothetical protein
MKSENTKEIVQWSVIALVAIGWFIWVWPTPYERVRLGSQEVRINRFTGTTQYLSSSGWGKISGASSTSSGTSNPTDEEIRFLQGSHIRLSGTYLEMDIFNSSLKQIQGDIIINIHITDKANGKDIERKIRKNVNIEPQKVESILELTGLSFDSYTQNITCFFEAVH